jgi:hypothetical protein
LRRGHGVAFVAFVACIWLNQGLTLDAWKVHAPDVRAPLWFLYRRAPDEELYFATASAILGRTYDERAFGIRGQTPLPPVEVPADGQLHVPYREVPLEYPPPNVPLIVAPRLVTGELTTYARVFGALMGALLTAAAALTLRGRSPKVFAVFAALLLAHGAIAIQRLDAVVALLAAWAVLQSDRKNDVALGIASGLLGAFKLVPIAIGVVLALRLERARAVRVLAWAGAVLVLGLLPMALASTDAVLAMLRYHSARGLHVEAALGTLYGTLRAVTGSPAVGALDYGSFNFHGPVPDALARVSPILTIVLLGLVVKAGRSAKGEEAAPLAAFGAMLALWLGGKVFSPQYLTWALPIAPCIRDRRILVGFGAVLVLSQAYYRGFFDHVYLQRPLGVVTMAVRLGLLVWLFVATLRRLSRSIA